MDHKLNNKTVCITDLGYVGLPLALTFSRHLKVIGFDVDDNKIKESKKPPLGAN
jgi:UDP-N-acetyl-D-mannosaminuronate dehydrogenase